jgi:hypothetical protein
MVRQEETGIGMLEPKHEMILRANRGQVNTKIGLKWVGLIIVGAGLWRPKSWPQRYSSTSSRRLETSKARPSLFLYFG